MAEATEFAPLASRYRKLLELNKEDKDHIAIIACDNLTKLLQEAKVENPDQLKDEAREAFAGYLDMIEPFLGYAIHTEVSVPITQVPITESKMSFMSKFPCTGDFFHWLSSDDKRMCRRGCDGKRPYCPRKWVWNGEISKSALTFERSQP